MLGTGKNSYNYLERVQKFYVSKKSIFRITIDTLAKSKKETALRVVFS
jgi:hypothetical protein